MAIITVGIFGEPPLALAAAAKIQGAGFVRPELMSPVPIAGVEVTLGEEKSVIKRFTFFGALFGAIFGFLLAAGTAVLYLHPTGGRPIITLPPFFIISYEMTILFGILATMIGFFISARLPAVSDRAYAPETAIDKFAVAVACDNQDECKRAAQILSEAGAEEVREMVEEG